MKKRAGKTRSQSSSSGSRAASSRPGPRHQFVFDVVIGCYPMAAHQRKAEVNQPRAVRLSFVRYRANQRTIRTGEFLQGLGDTILPNDGDIFLPLQFPDRLYRTKGAGIGSGCNQDSTILGVTPQEVSHPLTA